MRAATPRMETACRPSWACSITAISSIFSRGRVMRTAYTYTPYASKLSRETAVIARYCRLGLPREGETPDELTADNSARGIGWPCRNTVSIVS
jgi:hypothetical protein